MRENVTCVNRMLTVKCYNWLHNYIDDEWKIMYVRDAVLRCVTMTIDLKCSELLNF